VVTVQVEGGENSQGPDSGAPPSGTRRRVYDALTASDR
jgi:hypothetical protein